MGYEATASSDGRHEGVLTYATWSATDSTVRVRIYERTTNGVPVVVFTELDGNDGPSITNSVEYAIAALQQKFVFHVAPDFYEHYPRSSPEAASFDQIVSVSPAPQWRHANVEEVAARCGVDIDELLT